MRRRSNLPMMKNSTDFNTKTKDEKNKELERLIEMGTNGFFPLFYPEWINDSLLDKNKSRAYNSQLKSKEKIKKVYDSISRHRNIERQKTALMTLSKEDRNDFIQSFLHVVESQVVDNTARLH